MSVISSSNSSLQPDHCFIIRPGIFIFTAFFITYILLLPLSILVLYVGYQRWRKQRSVATAAMISHSDIFTFNMVAMELISVLGCCFYCCGAYSNQPLIREVGLGMFSISTPGQTLFHQLTCVDRYLAVVHPITYLGLRRAGGVRIRNISIGCAWLICLATLGLSKAFVHYDMIFSFLSLVLSCVVVSFCSLSMLCILIHPGPGEVGGKRKQVDQSKQRAFHTIMAIAGALLLRFLCTLVVTVIYISSVLSSTDYCFLFLSSLWFNVPSSLVLPLLFLHRAGKLPSCKHNTGSDGAGEMAFD